MRGEEAERVVAPVVGEAASDDERLGDEMLHRQQFDGVDPDVEQVLDHRRVGETPVGAAQVLGHRRVQPGVALHVQLVDDHVGERARLVQRTRRRGVGDDHGQGNRAGGVGGVGHVVGFGGVIEDRAGIVDPRGDGPGVGIEQEFRGVEAHAGVGIPFAVHPVAVALFRRDPLDVHHPDAVVVAVQVVVHLAAVVVDERELDPGGTGCPEGEVAPVVTQLCPEDRRVERGARVFGHGSCSSHGPVGCTRRVAYHCREAVHRWRPRTRIIVPWDPNSCRFRCGCRGRQLPEDPGEPPAQPDNHARPAPGWPIR